MGSCVRLPFTTLAKAYLEDGTTLREIADSLNVSVTVVRREADYWGLPKKQHRLGGCSSEYLPTQEEIRTECEKIRAGWSDDMWESRCRHGLKIYPARMIGR
jgi:Zn-dependent peptidase ImmA (M78 family)